MRRIRGLAALIAATMALTAAPALGDQHRGEPVIDSTGFGEWWYNDDADEVVLVSGEIDCAQWCFSATLELYPQNLVSTDVDVPTAYLDGSLLPDDWVPRPAP